MRRLREWSFRIRRESEARFVSDLPPRDRLRFYAAVLVSKDRRSLVRYFAARFRKWIVLPGAVWVNYQAAQTAEIVEVKNRYVVAEVVADQLRDAVEHGHPTPPVRILERIARDDWRWIPQ